MLLNETNTVTDWQEKKHKKVWFNTLETFSIFHSWYFDHFESRGSYPTFYWHKAQYPHPEGVHRCVRGRVWGLSPNVSRPIHHHLSMPLTVPNKNISIMSLQISVHETINNIKSALKPETLFLGEHQRYLLLSSF